MERTLVLARKGWGNTSPNPMVGAVLVKNGKIIGEGYHKYAGADHAEVMAIKEAKARLPRYAPIKEQASGSTTRNDNKGVAGATLYVNLEPCCHYGRTPPCTGAIIESGIKRVVIGTKDSDSRVSGKGLAVLKEAGVIVKTGVLEKESQRLNEGYLYYKKTGLPFVIMKMAQTLDGKIALANGKSKWITGKESREYVQEIRSGVDAILVGSGTVMADDPELVVHPIRDSVSNGVHGTTKYHRYPARIILDSRGRLPITAKVFGVGKSASLHSRRIVKDSPKTYWVVGKSYEFQVSSFKLKENIVIMPMDTINKHINIKSLLRELGKLGIQSILVEGGAGVHGAFLDAKVGNKVLCFIAPKLMGGAKSISSIAGKGIKSLAEMRKLKDMTVSFLGEDIVIEGYL